MHYRGCSGDINRLPRTYHAGETGDPDFVIGWLRHHYPGVALFAVGFSLGGNMLLKLLGEQAGSCVLSGAAARDYYAKDSCRQYLPQITTRTLIVQSHDDPFIEAVQIPKEQELGPGVHLELAARGGHLGFVTGPLPGCTEYWLERRLTVFFTHLTGEFN